MLVRAGFEIMYSCPAPTPMLLTLSLHPEVLGGVKGGHGTRFDREVRASGYIDGFGNACTRIVAPEGVTSITADFVIEAEGAPAGDGLGQCAVEALPDDILVYLLGSRYCDTDRLSDIAWGLFGGVSGAARVAAVCAYTRDRLVFDYDHADPTRTAWGAHHARQGVGRDYAHLAIALCRCMNIPARYCTGYLGDIGVAPREEPMDFGSWFEAYLEGGWQVFDALHGPGRAGRVLMARGRDATDVALCTTFGPCRMEGFRVMTEAAGAVPGWG